MSFLYRLWRQTCRTRPLPCRRLLLEVLENRLVPSGFGDFNGDGYDDLAIGVPGEDLGEIVDAGAINVIYGTAGGLGVGGDQIWTQDSESMRGVAEGLDRFGEALAAGDFDNDGFSDLAIGIPGQDVNLFASAGAVQILYGSATGLTANRDAIFTQNTAGILDKSRTGDEFGWALAVGDLNGDGFDDLVIGVPFEDVALTDASGAINVIYGSAAGLTATGNQFWNQQVTGMSDTAESGDAFGSVLAVGYFNSDTYADLAIGVRREDLEAGLTYFDLGAIHVMYGSTAGLTTANNQVWTQNELAASDGLGDYDYFGAALAAGDFDGNGTDDLAIGAPGEDIGGFSNAGAVSIMYSSSVGLGSFGDQFWHHDSEGIFGAAADGNVFGITLAAADFNADGFADLAAGTPFDDYLQFDSGTVNVIHGSTFGLTATGNHYWAQLQLDSSDGPEQSDYFGYGLAAADFNGDGKPDLAVGAYGEDITVAGGGVTNDGGLVNIIYSADEVGLTDQGNQTWWQNYPKIEGASELGDVFGWALG